MNKSWISFMYPKTKTVSHLSRSLGLKFPLIQIEIQGGKPWLKDISFRILSDIWVHVLLKVPIATIWESKQITGWQIAVNAQFVENTTYYRVVRRKMFFWWPSNNMVVEEIEVKISKGGSTDILSTWLTWSHYLISWQLSVFDCSEVLF